MNFFSLFFLLLISSSILYSEEKFIYFDGSEQRTIFLLPDYVAELNNGHSSGLRSLQKNIRPILSRGNLEIFRASDAGLKTSIKSNQYSNGVLQVFSENHSPDRYVIPVGNIIVQFDGSIKNISDANSWASRNGSRILKHLFGNHYLLESAPGIPSIETANRFRTLESVLSATPDLIKPFSLR